MADRTIDILLNLQAKPTGADALISKFKELEDMADRYGRALSMAEKQFGKNSKEAKILRDALVKVDAEMKDISAEAKKRELEKSLATASTKANQLRERMEKVAQVGNRMAVTGAAIIAPFALSLNKYLEAQKAIEANGGKMEGNAARIIELQKRWADSQVKIGRVTAEIVLPALEKALNVVDKITAFAEKNPGAVKAAVGIGGTLVVLGGMLSTAATIVSTIATIQGVAAGFGIGGGVAAGGTAAAGGAVAGGAGLAGLGASIAAAISAAAPFIAIAAAVAIAAEGTRQILNWALGTSTTWADIGETARQLAIISAEGWKLLFSKLVELGRQFGIWIQAIPQKIGTYITQGINSVIKYLAGLGQSMYNGMVKLGEAMKQGLIGLVLGGRATGGYVDNGVYRMGEKGREFVLNASTTRAAENVMGGQLTQQRAMSAFGGGRRIEYHDNRRIDSSLSQNDRRVIRSDVMDALARSI